MIQPGGATTPGRPVSMPMGPSGPVPMVRHAPVGVPVPRQFVRLDEGSNGATDVQKVREELEVWGPGFLGSRFRMIFQDPTWENMVEQIQELFE